MLGRFIEVLRQYRNGISTPVDAPYRFLKRKKSAVTKRATKFVGRTSNQKTYRDGFTKDNVTRGKMKPSISRRLLRPLRSFLFKWKSQKKIPVGNDQFYGTV